MIDTKETASFQMIRAIHATANTLLVLTEEMAWVARDCEFLNALGENSIGEQTRQRHMDMMQEILRQLNSSVSDALNFLTDCQDLDEHQSAVTNQSQRQTALALSANSR